MDEFVDGLMANPVRERGWGLGKKEWTLFW